MVGQRLSHYFIVEKIGAGGMGVVYRAHDERLNRDVALKILPATMLADEVARKRFRKEAQALSKLNHPNIATVYDFDTTQDLDFLAMELIVGTNLSEKLAAGALPEKEVVHLSAQLVEGLAAAHEQGIVHRDLKPGNLRVTPDGRLKILDFGLAKLVQPVSDAAATVSLTETQEAGGTLPYMAPEQLRGEPVDARSDIYAAGAVLYEMATGRRPFDQKLALALADDILHRRPPGPRQLNPKLSPCLEGIVVKCLKKEPENRYQSAKELLVDLQRLATGVAARSRPSREAVLVATLAAVAIVAVLVALDVGELRERLFGRSRSGEKGVSLPTGPIKMRRSVAVLGFKNLSGRSDEEWVSTALAEMLTTELSAGEQLRTISGEDVAHAKISLSLSDADSYGKDTLGRIRKNLGTDYVVLGSYLDLGKESDGQVRLDLRLQDAAAGETIATVSETGTEARLPDLIFRTGAALREKLGAGQVSDIEAAAVRASFPSNAEAARLYSEGLAKLRVFDYQTSRNLLQEAVAADPGYPLAHLALSLVWEKLGEKEWSYKLMTAREEVAREEAERAFDLSANLSREDRLWVEAQYRATRKEFDKAAEIYRTLFRLFPDNVDYGLALAEIQGSDDRTQKGTLATLEAMRKLPAPARDDPRIDYSEARAADAAGDFRRAQAAADRAAKQGNALGARLLVAHAHTLECELFLRLAQPKQARASCEQARQVFAEVGDRGSLAFVLQGIAWALHQEGDFGRAKRTFEGVLALCRQIGGNWCVKRTLDRLASALSDQGDYAGAMKRLEELLATDREMGEEGHPEVTLMMIAAVLTVQGDLAGAKRRLQKALPTDIGPADLEAALALADLAHVLYLKGNLEGAKKTLDEALPIIRDIPAIFGEAAFATRVELSFLLSSAELSIEEGHRSGAEAPLRKAIAKFRASAEVSPQLDIWDIWEIQVGAETGLAKTLLSDGKVTEAQEEIESAGELVAKIQNRTRRLEYAVVAARIRAAAGQPTEAKKTLEAVLLEATKYGDVSCRYEASLVLGEIEMRSGEVVAGRARLAGLEKEATAKGFLLIAHKSAVAIS